MQKTVIVLLELLKKENIGGIFKRYRRTDQALTIKNCYYNNETCETAYLDNTTGKGLTTDNMKKQESYIGWDFENTWKMGEDGYPELRFNENN